MKKLTRRRDTRTTIMTLQLVLFSAIIAQVEPAHICKSQQSHNQDLVLLSNPSKKQKSHMMIWAELSHRRPSPYVSGFSTFQGSVLSISDSLHQSTLQYPLTNTMLWHCRIFRHTNHNLILSLLATWHSLPG